MTRYFVAPTGSDANSGLTTSAPWKTVGRVNTASANATIVQGDQVSFLRGGTYYGKLIPPASLAAGSSGWLKLDAYGSGERPTLSSYKVLTSAAAWTQYDANTWQIDLSSANAGTGYFGYDNVQGGGADVGFLKVDGVIYGRRRSTMAALGGQWDYYCSGNTLYVRSTANPTTLAADVRCSVDGPGILLRSALDVSGLRVVGTGGHGMRDASGGGASRVRIRDCEIAEIGGSVLESFGDGTVRYGNGIEVWITSSDFVIERNKIHDVYDVAFTCQGGDGTNPGGWTDIAFRKNLVYRCSQSIEFWSGGTGATGGFANIVAELNTCLFAGYGWGGDVRPDVNQRSHLLTYGWELPADIKVRNNIFYDARSAYRYRTAATPGLVSTGNVIAQRASGLMRYSQPETIEQGAAWATRENVEARSQFTTLPASGTTTISDADVTAALAGLSALPKSGQLVRTGSGIRAVPTHSPWG